MFFRDSIRSTYGYNFWANGQLLKKSREIDPSEFDEDLGVGHGSLQKTLFHILKMEEIWFGLIKDGRPSDAPFKEAEFGELSKFEAGWKQIEHQYMGYLDRAAEADLMAIVETKDQNGIVTPIPRWRMLQHVLYHSAQHRAEAALILIHLGHSPGNLDFINY